VIAIISVLATLLCSALPAAKRRADSAHCTSNQRQVQLAIQLFVVDNERFPIGNTSSDLSAARFWINDAEDYSKSKWPRNNLTKRLQPTGLFVCPSYNRVSGYYLNTATPIPFGAYGYNYFGVGGGIPVKVSSSGSSFYYKGFPGLGLGGELPADKEEVVSGMPFKSDYRAIREAAVLAPSDMISIGDSTIADALLDSKQLGTIDISAGPRIMKFVLKDATDTASARAMRSRHSGKEITSFVDGHVESSPIEQVFDPRQPERARRWNNDNRPHAERSQ